MSMTLAERDWGDGDITDIAYLQGRFQAPALPATMLLASPMSLSRIVQAQVILDG